MWGFSECRAVSQLLWNYSANRLSADESARVERHISRCDACRAEADGYRQTVGALASMRRDGIPQSRRGWRELQTRLSEPQVRAVAFRPRFSLPPLAWGSFVAAAGAITIMFFSNQPVNNKLHADLESAGGAGIVTDRSGMVASADSQDPFNFDDTYVDTSTDPAVASHPTPGRRMKHGSITAGSAAASQRGVLRPIHVEDGGLSSRHTYVDVRRTSRPAGARLDARHLDGAGSSTAVEPRNYVLSSVSAASDSDSGADYVMGSVMMNSRTADTEEARGL